MTPQQRAEEIASQYATPQSPDWLMICKAYMTGHTQGENDERAEKSELETRSYISSGEFKGQTYAKMQRLEMENSYLRNQMSTVSQNLNLLLKNFDSDMSEQITENIKYTIVTSIGRLDEARK